MSITISWEGDTVSVRGPADFVGRIDWDRVMTSAEMYAAVAGATGQARGGVDEARGHVETAIRMQYAEWRGLQSLIPRGRAP